MTDTNPGEQGDSAGSAGLEGDPSSDPFAVDDVPGEFQGEVDKAMGEAVDALASRNRRGLLAVSVFAVGTALAEVTETVLDATPGVLIAGGIRGASIVACGPLLIRAVNKGREAAYGVYHANYVLSERRRLAEAPDSSRSSSRARAREQSLTPYSDIRAYRKDRKRRVKMRKSILDSGRK